MEYEDNHDGCVVKCWLCTYVYAGETGIVSNYVPDREGCMLTITRKITGMNSLSVFGVLILFYEGLRNKSYERRNRYHFV